MRKSLVVIFLLSMLCAQAQELNFWQKANNLLTKFKNIDSAYVYQPKQGFTLGLFSSIQRAGIDATAMFAVNPNNGETLSGVSKYSMREGISPKVGLELGYGKFVLGYGVEVGPKRAYKKRAFGLNLLGKSWGLHFNYFNIHNRFKTSIFIGEEGQDDYYAEEILSQDPAKLECLYVDGYYVFNHKRFAYPAAYKAGLVQRRTAGSWMVTARYMQGDLNNSPEAFLESYGLMDDLFTIQASVGGGYSANFVCWHKDPTYPHDKGLRNITINLTALPVITAVNYLKIKSYEYDEDELENEIVSETYCYPMPNFVGSTAIAMTLDRFFISTQFVYNWFYFRSSDTIKFNDQQILSRVDDLNFRGSFHNWTFKLLFTYKF